ncbi:polymerase delta-interacting protein 2 [Dirofilaria immitis]|nr:polymerase delta-interacting protein 2 [Dirofilaria immitis]
MTGLLTQRGLIFGIAPIRSFFHHARFWQGMAKLREGNGNIFLKDLGRLTVIQTDDEPYTPGQLFIHKLFPYRGIVLCSFPCSVEEKLLSSNNDDPIVITHKSLFYQALIHCGDWKNMHFPVDITSYLEDAGTIHGEKVLTVVFGMDCVPHDEIIPFRTHITRPIVHNLFDLIFSIRKEPSFLIGQHSNCILNQLKPHFAYRETTDGIRVTVITFYLGLNTVSGQQKHWWRYVIRLENLKPCHIIIRSREMKVYSLSNMQQQKIPSIAGGNPRLTPEEPAFQYSGMVGVVVDKGSYAWFGNFTMEREEDRTSFLVKVPTFRLEYDSNPTPEKTEQLS